MKRNSSDSDDEPPTGQQPRQDSDAIPKVMHQRKESELQGIAGGLGESEDWEDM